MSALVEIISPSFLLRDALYAAIVIGLLCPLVGVYLVLRRMIFLGVALPQVSASGIAFAFMAYSQLFQGHQHGESGERILALAGSIGFTLFALLVLAALEGRGVHSAESRVGAAYALAASFTILFLATDPHGEAQMVNLLKGDMLSTTTESLITVAVTYSIVAAFVLKFRRQLLLVSFDRELAQVFRMRVAVWDTLLYVGLGTVIAVGVMSAGPLVVFGFMTIPPLIARTVSRRMGSFSLISSLIGGTAAFFGFYLAYVFDMPLGPAEVALLGIALVLTATAKKAWTTWAA